MCEHALEYVDKSCLDHKIRNFSSNNLKWLSMPKGEMNRKRKSIDCAWRWEEKGEGEVDEGLDTE